MEKKNMNKLVILSGPFASGKSSFVKYHGLSKYTLSEESIRLMLDAPQMTEYGYETPQRDSKLVFEQLHNMLEQRMKKGAFTVVDSAHVSERDFTRYKILCKTYRYKMIVVPFRTSLEELLERNNALGLNKVPEDYIIYQKNQFDKLNVSFGTIVEPEKFDAYIQYYPQDLSDYKAVHHIGDIHGCFSVMSNILPLKDDEFYIFLGDYFDRGIQNAEVATWLINNFNRPNVIFLKGNHELHLDDYLNGHEIKSSEFEKTITDFHAAKIKKKNLRDFANSLQSVYLYSYKNKTVFCSHGGTSFYPENINFIDPIQFVRGVGNFSSDIDELFTAPENTYQVHGHRNITRLPIFAGKQSFNLTDEIEFGGYLRVLTLTEKGFKAMKYKNNVYSQRDIDADKNMFDTLSNDKDITVKNFGDISSINFSRKAFYNKTWNERTMMARGLFVDNKNYNVVCRGYEKFFNVDEVESTTIEALKNVKFPLTAYIKENGYLGLLGVDERSESLIFASKSSLDSDYAKQFEKIVRDAIPAETLEKLRFEMLQRNNCLVFEVIDPVFDPHIIEYSEPHVILLDIIDRDYKFSKQSYGQVVSFAKRYGFAFKKKAKTITSYDSLVAFINSAKEYNFEFNDEKIEGFVIEDADGFQFKVKTGYYNFWKTVRRIIFEKGNINKAATYMPEEQVKMLYDVVSFHHDDMTLFEIRKSFEK